MNLSPKYLIKILEQHDFIFKRSKGSHQLYYNPITNKTIITGTWWQGYEKRYFSRYTQTSWY